MLPAPARFRLNPPDRVGGFLYRLPAVCGVQGYNGIAAADGKNQVIIAAEAFGSGTESEHFPAMLDSLGENMKTLTGNNRPLEEAIMEGDTGYFTGRNLKEAKERNIEVIIPDQQFRKRDEQFDGRPGHGGKGRYTVKDFEYDEKGNRYRCPAGKELSHKGNVKLNRNSGEKYQAKSGDCKGCPLQQQCMASRGGKSPKRTLYIVDRSEGENLCEEMRKKIDGAKYRALYGRRMQIIEPCFSDMSYCKGMNRFSLRTKIKVNIQWLLYCIVHNTGKCIPGILAESEG